MKIRFKAFSTGTLLTIAFLLGIMLLLSMPFSASAAAPSIYVGDVLISSGQYLAVGSDTPVEEVPSGGYAYFDAAGLVLKDYTYEGWGYEESQNNFYLVYAEGDLNIILLGENSLKASASVNADFTGINVKSGSLNIKGPGKLTIDASTPIRVDKGDLAGDLAGDLSIEGGRLNLTHRGNTWGIYTSGSISISGGIHSVTGFYAALHANNGITVSGGSLTATGNNNAIGSDLSVTGGALLAVSTGEESCAFSSAKTVDFSALTNAAVFGFDNAEGNNAAVYDEADRNTYMRVLVKPTVHNVWIGGTQLSDTYMPAGVFFEPLSRTLTLTNFTCENTAGHTFFGALKALVYSDDDLNIVLSGENTLTAMEGEYGISLASNRLLTIDTKEGETGALNVSGAYGIKAVSEIKGGNITVVGTEVAMLTTPEMSAAPDLRRYYETPCIKASKNADGTALTQDYDASEIAEYKYIRFAEGAKIEYYLNGELKASEIVEIGEAYQMPACEYTLPFDYLFDGWALGAVDSTTVYDAEDTVTVTENMAFHAVLKLKTATVRVYYPKAGAHAAVEYVLPYGTHTLDFIDAVVTPPEGLELKGFSEWYMSEPVTEVEVGPYGASLYAIWGAEDGVTFYDLYVGGIPVTAQNKGDILGDGTAVYNSDTKTLTLTNMSLTAEEALFADVDYSLGSIIALGELNILLVGENSIVTEYGSGISVEDLTISAGDENGALDIDAYEYAISCYELTVESGAYHLVGSSGLDAYLVTVNGGNFDIEAADDASGAGIFAYRAVINGGIINILFDRSISVAEGGLEINGGEITVTDVGTAIEAFGDVVINGGKLTLHGLDESYCGILVSDGNVVINGEDTVVEIDGFAVGIHLDTSYSGFVMTDGSLKINAESCGVFVREPSAYNEPDIRRGTLEISAGKAGCTVAYLDGGTPRPIPYHYILRDKSADITASVNADGSEAVKYNEDDLETYKYVKITVKVSYGIVIADSEDNGVLIDETNNTDVLGNGTVSYDPATHTLTLNGYKYEGEGFVYDYYNYGILVLPNFMDALTIVLEGENEIRLTTEDANAITVWGPDAVMKGDGSLKLNSEYGIYVEGDLNVQGGNIAVNAFDAVCAYDFKMTGGSITLHATYAMYANHFAIADGTITITASGEDAYAIYAHYYFIMNGGSVKINTDHEGICVGTLGATLDVCGGTLEISTEKAGYAFMRYDSGDCLPTLPTTWGEGTVTASVNADGSGAVAFDEAAFETYKYVKATVKVSYGIVIADGEDNGVMIDETNYANPLGDGTVSYNPITHTLTLNGYKYEGSGFEDDERYYGILVIPDYMDTLTLVLKGENEITLAGDVGDAISIRETDLVIKGDGTLTVTTNGEDICSIYAYSFTMNGGTITINANGEYAGAIYASESFVMTGGSIKISTDYMGIAVWSDGTLTIRGGTLEISTEKAGYAFIRYDSGDFLPTLPTTVTGDYKMAASVNEDGSDTVTFNEDDFKTYKYVSIHVHDYGTAWESDANEHWNECACGEKTNKAAHSGGTATCQAKAKCEVCNAEYGELAACAGGTATCTEKAKCATCGNEYGELAPHNYNIADGYKGADGHANTCSCGAHDTPAAHTPDRTEATETDPIKCTVCGYIIEPIKGHVHAPKSEWKSDEDNHWHECTGCEGQQLEKAAHTDNDTNGACDVCGYTMPVSHTHDYGTTWKTDANNHWKECECGEKSENAAHIDGNGDNKCDTCDYAMSAHDPDDPGTTPPADNPPTDDEGGLGAGAIVGIVIGSVAVVGVGGFALFWFVIKKKTWADFLAIFKRK